MHPRCLIWRRWRTACCVCEQGLISSAKVNLIHVHDVAAACNCSDTPTTDTPVCANDLVTYGNECVAKCANVLIVSEGQCPVCDVQPGDCQCGDGAYEPVCAFGLTWSDKCDADCGGYSCPQVSAFSVKWQ